MDYENSDGDDVSTGATKTVTVNVGTSPTAEVSYSGETEPSGISGLGTLGPLELLHNADWYIVTANAGSSSKPYKMKVDATSRYNAGHTKGWQDFYDSDDWAGHWTGDGTHGTTAGKHYVTGPNRAGNGWEAYYCIEDEAAAAGISLEAHSHSGYLNKAQCGITQDEMPVYYGKMYMWNGSNYVAITSSDYYWFYSSSNLGSRYVYY